MTKMKFTPGPWRIEEPLFNILSIVAGGPEPYRWDHICQIGTEALGEDDNVNAIANARLIAVAPNLYEALKKVKNELSGLIHPALPGKPAISDWPCDNPGDRECLDEAWDVISVAIASVECHQP